MLATTLVSNLKIPLITLTYRFRLLQVSPVLPETSKERVNWRRQIPVFPTDDQQAQRPKGGRPNKGLAQNRDC